MKSEIRQELGQKCCGSSCRRRLAALICLAAICGAPGFGQDSVGGDLAGTSSLVVRVFDDRNKPLRGVSLLAQHLSTAEVFRCPGTNRKGRCKLSGLPYGYFEIAISAPEGVFIAERAVNLPPAGVVELSLAAGRFAPTEEPRTFPGTEVASTGTLALTKHLRGRDFWRSPKGVAVLTALGGVALLVLVGSADDPDSTVGN